MKAQMTVAAFCKAHPEVVEAFAEMAPSERRAYVSQYEADHAMVLIARHFNGQRLYLVQSGRSKGNWWSDRKADAKRVLLRRADRLIRKLKQFDYFAAHSTYRKEHL